MDAKPLLPKLLQIPIFRGLLESEATRIVEVAQELSVPKGAVLFREGDSGDGLYVVLQGQIEITKTGPLGTPQSLARIGDGSVIGEMALLGGAAARSATAEASTDVKLLKIPSAHFSQLLKDDSVAALKVVYNLAQVMSRRLLLMDEKLVGLLDKGKKKEELADFQRILSNWSF